MCRLKAHDATTGQRHWRPGGCDGTLTQRTSRCPRTPLKEDRIVLSYCFSWTPLVILMTVVLLALPWLGLIALFVFSLLVLGLLATLVWTVIWVPRRLSLAVRNRWRVPDNASRAAVPAEALSVEASGVRPAGPVPVAVSVLFADRPASRPGSMT